MFKLAAIVVFLNCIALADTKLVVLMIGPPGAGKSTQAHRVSRKYHIPSVSMSELFVGLRETVVAPMSPALFVM